MADDEPWKLSEDGYLNADSESRSVICHPNLNVILLITKANEVVVIDVNSGSVLQRNSLSANASGNLQGAYLPGLDKVLLTDGSSVGVRSDYNGVLLLDTILQPPVQKADDYVSLELLYTEAVLLQWCLRQMDLPGVYQVADVLQELVTSTKEAQAKPKRTIKSQKWNTVCLQLPHSVLKPVCSGLVAELKRQNRHIPVLPVVSALNERLNSLLPPTFPLLEAPGSPAERCLMYSEAARRETFSKWPHMNYKWALPDQMAQAGFYHQPNAAGDDRAMCFTCIVCLVCWEPTDEPWSEHERHSPSCPFVRGEYTQNVPLSVTYATAPAVPMLHPPSLEPDQDTSSVTGRSPELGSSKFKPSSAPQFICPKDVKLGTSSVPELAITICSNGYVCIWNAQRQVKKEASFFVLGEDPQVVQQLLQQKYPLSRKHQTDHSYTKVKHKHHKKHPQKYLQKQLQKHPQKHSSKHSSKQKPPLKQSQKQAQKLPLKLSQKPEQDTPETVEEEPKKERDKNDCDSFADVPKPPREAWLQAEVDGECDKSEAPSSDPTVDGPIPKQHTVEATAGSIVGGSQQRRGNLRLQPVAVVGLELLPGCNTCPRQDIPTWGGAGDVVRIMNDANQANNCEAGSIDIMKVNKDPSRAFPTHSQEPDRTLYLVVYDFRHQTCDETEDDDGGNSGSSGSGSGSGSGKKISKGGTTKKYVSGTGTSASTSGTRQENNMYQDIFLPKFLYDPPVIQDGDAGILISGSADAMIDGLEFSPPSSVFSPPDYTLNMLHQMTLANSSGGGTAVIPHSLLNGYLSDSKKSSSKKEPAPSNAPEPVKSKQFEPVAVQCLPLPVAYRNSHLQIHAIHPSKDGGHLLVILLDRDRSLNHQDRTNSTVCESAMDVDHEDDIANVTEDQAKEEQSVLLVYALDWSGDMVKIDETPVNVRELSKAGEAPLNVTLLPLQERDESEENDDNGSEQMVAGHPSGLASVVCADGKLRILNLATLRFLAEAVPSMKAKFVSATYCTNLERVCACTEQGSLHFFPLRWNEMGMLPLLPGPSAPQPCTSSGSNSHLDFSSTNSTDLLVNSTLISSELRQLLELTQWENLTPCYAATVPPCWSEMMQAQKQRRHPQHLQQGDEAQHTRTWRLQRDATTWDEHVFEITLPKSCTVGHVCLKFSLHSPCTPPPNIQVTLLKQNVSGIGHKQPASMPVDNSIDFGLGMDQGSSKESVENPVMSEEYLRAHNAEILCGPVNLAQCLDLSDQGGSITLTSPKLMRSRGRTLQLHLKALADPANTHRTTEDKSTSSKKSRMDNGNSSNGAANGVSYPSLPGITASGKTYYVTISHGVGVPTVRQGPSGLSTTLPMKKTENFIGCDWLQEVSIAIRRTKQTSVPNERSQRCAMLESNTFVERLLRVVCLEGLDRSSTAQSLALDLLTWVASIRLSPHRDKQQHHQKQQVELGQIIKEHLSSLVRHCFLLSGRSIAHKCLKLILVCTEGVKNINETEGHDLESTVLQALLEWLPSVGAVQSAGALRWFLLLLMRVAPLDTAGIAGHECVALLSHIARELSSRSNPYHLLLRTRFGLYGTPFEPELFDVEPPVSAQSISMPITYASVVQGENSVVNTAGALGSMLPGTSGLMNDALDLRELLSVPVTSENKATNTSSAGMASTTTSSAAGNGVGASSNMSSASGGAPARLRGLASNNYMKGLLEVEPLHYTCHAASDGTKLEKIEPGCGCTIPVGNFIALGTTGTKKADGDFMCFCLGKDMPEDKWEEMQDKVSHLNQVVHSRLTSIFRQVKPLGLLSQEGESSSTSSSQQSSTNSSPWLPQYTAPDKLPTPPQPQPQPQSQPSQQSPQQSPPTQPQAQDHEAPTCSTKKQDSKKGDELSSLLMPWQQLLVPPPQQTVVIERMHSGARRFVVLDFGSPVMLTDMMVPACCDLLLLSVDVWLCSEEQDGQRLVVASDIATKALVLSDLQPPPICRYLKITTIGRYGMTTTKCKIPIGSFFGHTMLLPGECADNIDVPTLSEVNLQAQVGVLRALLEDIHCRYALACSRLRELLAPLLQGETPNVSHMHCYLQRTRDSDRLISSQDNQRVISAYQECITFQHQLNVVRSVMDRLENARGGAGASLLENDSRQLIIQASTDKLRVLGEGLLDILLYLGSVPRLTVSMERTVCEELFHWLCVGEDTRMQLSAATLLARLCGMQAWWGQFLADTLLNLFCSNNVMLFPQDRVFILLAYLGRKSLALASARTSVLDAVLSMLGRLLEPLCTRNDVQPLRNHTDLGLVGWALLFVSQCLDVGSPSREEDGSDKPSSKDSSQHSRWDFIQGEVAMQKRAAAGGRTRGNAMRTKRIMVHKQQFGSVQDDFEVAKKAFQASTQALSALSSQAANLSNKLETALKQQEHYFKKAIKHPANHLKEAVNLRRLDAKRAWAGAGRRVGSTSGPSGERGEADGAPDTRDSGMSMWLPHANCLPVARGLIALLLHMDFTCNIDMFLLACKVLARIVSCSRPALTLGDLMTSNQLLKLVRMAVWHDPHQTSWGGPWAAHAITCLLQDVLDGVRMAPPSNSRDRSPEDSEGAAGASGASAAGASAAGVSAAGASAAGASGAAAGAASAATAGPSTSEASTSTAELHSAGEPSVPYIGPILPPMELTTATSPGPSPGPSSGPSPGPSPGPPLGPATSPGPSAAASDNPSAGASAASSGSGRTDQVAALLELIENRDCILEGQEDMVAEDCPDAAVAQPGTSSAGKNTMVVLESDDSELDDYLDDILEHGRSLLKKGNTNRTSITASSSISTAMDARLEYGVDSHAEVLIRRLTMLGAYNLPFSVNSVFHPSAENMRPVPPPPSACQLPDNEPASCLSMLTACFDKVFTELQIQGSWTNLELVLQLWLTLNMESSFDAVIHRFDPSSCPIVGLSPSAISGLLSALTWQPELSVRTWCLAFQCLTVVSNTPYADALERWGPDATQGMANAISSDPQFVPMLLRFLSGSGISSQHTDVGPTVCVALRDLLVRLMVRTDMGPVRKPAGWLSNMLLRVAHQLIAADGAVAGHRGPLDAQCAFFTLLLGCNFTSNVIDLGMTMSLLESVGVLIHTYIMTSEKVRSRSVTEANQSASMCFGGLLSCVIGGDLKPTKSTSWDTLVCTVLKLACILVQSPLHRLEGMESMEFSESGAQTAPADMSQTDEHKAKHQGSSHSSTQTEARVPCIADTVLQHQATMVRLLSALAGCVGSPLAVLLGTRGECDAREPRALASAMSGEPLSVGDGTFHLLLTLSRKASHPRLLLRPVFDFLASVRDGATVVPNSQFSGVLQLSEPLLWFIMKVLDSSESLTLFNNMGGVKVICENLVHSSRVLVSSHPSLVSVVMQHLSRSSPPMPSTSKKVSQPLETYEGLQNFAPLGTISSSSPTAQPAEVLIQSSPSHRRARTPAWSYHFYPDELHMDLMLRLPCAVLLKEVQLQPHLTSLATCPSAVGLEVSRDGSSALVPLCAPLPTSGMTFVRLTLDRPEVVTCVLLRLYRPHDSANIGLSQVRLLGSTTFGETAYRSQNWDVPEEEHLTKSSLGWLRLLHHCLNVGNNVTDLQSSLISSAAGVPGLLDACGGLLLLPAPAPPLLTTALERVLLRLGLHSRELGLRLLQGLLRSSPTTLLHSSAPTGPDSIVDLIYLLGTTRDPDTGARVEAMLNWLQETATAALQAKQTSSWINEVQTSAACIHSIAAVLWSSHINGAEYNLSGLILPKLFFDLYHWTLLLPASNAVKTALDAVICSMCYIQPELFPGLVLRMGAVAPPNNNSASVSDDTKDMEQDTSSMTDDRKQAMGAWSGHVHLSEGQLMTLALACQSPPAVRHLLDSGLPSRLSHSMLEFCFHEQELENGEPCSYHAACNSSMTDADKVIGTTTVKAMARILKLFAELCSEGKLRDWLGSQEGSLFWPALLRLLCSRNSRQSSGAEPLAHAYADLEMAALQFLSRCCSCHPDNQRRLASVMCEVISLQEARQHNVTFLHGVSGFTRRLVLQLLLESEKLRVLVRADTPLQRACGTAAGAGLRHPSHGVGHHSQLLLLSTQTTCAELIKLVGGNNSLAPLLGERLPPDGSSGNSSGGTNSCSGLRKQAKEMSEFGLCFTDPLSFAAGVTAKDKRSKDAKNAATRGPFAKKTRISDPAGSSGLSQGLGLSPERWLEHMQLLPGLPLPGQLTIGQLLVAVKERGHSLSAACIEVNLKQAGPDCPAPPKDGISNEMLQLSPLPTPLQVFTMQGGLALLAQHLPLVYPETLRYASSDKPSQTVPSPDAMDSDWVKVDGSNIDLYEDLDDSILLGSSSPHTAGRQSSVNLIPTSVPPHSLAAFGLFLRLPGYAEVLLRDRKKAQCLLRLVLGVSDDGEGGDILSSPVAFALPTLPFQVLRQLLDATPLTTDDGVFLRRTAMDVGAIHLLLACLAVFSHQAQDIHLPGVQHELVIAATKASAGTSHEVKPTKTDDKSQQYWAKGTGFGTGSTTQSWNVEQALLRQRSEEEHVTVLLQAISSSLNPGDVAPPHYHDSASDSDSDSGDARSEHARLPPNLPTLLQQSCLLPAVCSYLRNDSVLDMARHIPLYRAVLQVLRALAVSPQLVSLLLPMDRRFNRGGASTSASSGSSESLSAVCLLTKMKSCVDTYASRLKLNRTKGSRKSSGSNTGPSSRLPNKFVEELEQDEGLAQLIADIQHTASLVQVATDRLVLDDDFGSGNGAAGSGSGHVDHPIKRSLEERYLEVMQKLQFDTFEMITENSEGGYQFAVSYHFESNLRSAGERCHPARVKRLAQETVTLSTSLPLSYSSSVYVRCDADRLDIMKVLITGPAETPYANGCFEFDVYFPPDYPNSPMLINMETTGHHTIRFNPNLYNDGKVCLSVLNTWHGRPEEKWNAQTSSFLQVLVSIQSLILVPEPYFNEPGYERSRGTPSGNQSSREYNANICQASVKWAMLEQVRNPCPCFREVIHTHFWFKKREIIQQIQSWITDMESQGNDRRNGRSISLNTVALKRHFEQLREELNKLKPPPGLEDLAEQLEAEDEPAAALLPHVTETPPFPSPSHTPPLHPSPDPDYVPSSSQPATPSAPFEHSDVDTDMEMEKIVSKVCE